MTTIYKYQIYIGIPLIFVVGFLFGKYHEYMYGYRGRYRRGNLHEDHIDIFKQAPSWEDPFTGGPIVKDRGWGRVGTGRNEDRS